MSRPERQAIGSLAEAWDGPTDANFQAIFDAPTPVFQVADLSTLTSTYTASSYDDCMAITADTHEIYVSNGSTWVKKSATTLDYSTSEQDTGIDWLSGSYPRIYQKTIDLGTLPTAATGTKSVAHSISNLDLVIKHECWINNETAGNQNPVPLVSTVASSNVQLQINDTNVIIKVESDRDDSTGYCTLFYTKSA